MSTVTLSKPHCAMTSAENPEGIASQAFTTTLPDAHISLTLFAIVPASFFRFLRHCKDREIRSTSELFRTVSLAMTTSLRRGPLDAGLAHADLARGTDDRGPGVVGQG